MTWPERPSHCGPSAGQLARGRSSSHGPGTAASRRPGVLCSPAHTYSHQADSLPVTGNWEPSNPFPNAGQNRPHYHPWAFSTSEVHSSVFKEEEEEEEDEEEEEEDEEEDRRRRRRRRRRRWKLWAGILSTESRGQEIRMVAEALDKPKGTGPNKRPVILGVEKPTEMLSDSKCVNHFHV